jgi:multiple sugar transport system substrate-binding protein
MATFSRRSLLKLAIATSASSALGIFVACTAVPTAVPTSTAPRLTSTLPAAPRAATAPVANTVPATLKGTRIVCLFWSGAEIEQLYRQEMTEFEAETGIKAEYSGVPFEDLMDREMTLAGAQSAEVDVFGTHYAQIGRFGDAMLPLNDFAANNNITADQYVKGSIDAFTVDGKLLALPFSFDMRALFYRTDLFKSGGVTSAPRTLDDLVEVAKKLNNPPDVYGYTIVGKADPALREFSDLLWGNGGDFLEKGLQPSPPAWNQDAGVQALQWWYDLIYTQKIAPPGVPSYGWEENTQLFASGQVAMNKDWGPATFKDPKQSRVKDTFSVAPLPAGASSPRTTGVCHGRGINKYSRNQAAAWEFVKWVTAKEQQVKMFNAIQAHPAHFAALQQVTNDATGIDKQALDAALVRANDAYTWPLFPSFSQVQPVLWGEIEKVLSNQKKPKDALDFAAGEALRIFKDAHLV